MNNATRLALKVAGRDVDELLVRRISQTPFWLVFEAQGGLWDVIVCDPKKDNSYVVATGLTQLEAMQAAQDSTRLELGTKLQKIVASMSACVRRIRSTTNFSYSLKRKKKHAKAN